MNALVHKGKPHDYDKYFGSCTILDKLAGAFESMGYMVTRWMSACGDPFPAQTKFDVAVIWCGFQNWYPPLKKHLRAMGTKILYCDVDHFGDWMDEGDTDYAFQLQYSIKDFPGGGVNGFACWRDFPITGEGKKLAVPDHDELFVCLQEDISLRVNPCMSPHFQDCVPWLYHLITSSQVPLRVSKHPYYKVSPVVNEMVRLAPNARWNEGKSLEDSLKTCCGLATIDSHSAIKALGAGVPVMNFGQSIYRREGVVWCCDSNMRRTNHITGMLKRRECGLDMAKQRQFLAYLRTRTWKVSELPGRLEDYLDSEESKEYD